MFNKVRTSFRWVKNTPLPADKATKKLIRALMNDLGNDLLLQEVSVTLPDRTVKETAVTIRLEERPDTSLFGNSAYGRMTDPHAYRTDKDGYGHMDFPDINGDWCHDEKRPGGVAAWFDTENPRNYQDLIFRQLTKAGIRPDSLNIIRYFWDFDPLLEPLEEKTEESPALPRIPFRPEHIEGINYDVLRPVTRSGQNVTDLSFGHTFYDEEDMAFGRIPRPEGAQDMVWDRNGHVLASGAEHPDDLFVEPFDEETFERLQSL